MTTKVSRMIEVIVKVTDKTGPYEVVTRASSTQQFDNTPKGIAAIPDWVKESVSNAVATTTSAVPLPIDNDLP